MRKSDFTTNVDGDNAIPHDCLVVVCDSERSRFLRNLGDAKEPALSQIDDLEQENPKAGAQVTDRPGRFNDGSSPHRSAMQETDHHELEKQRFARSLADMLNRVSQDGGYDHLVLVAAPRVLGEMRPHLSKEVQGKLRLEVDKDLTHHEVSEIQKILLSA